MVTPEILGDVDAALHVVQDSLFTAGDSYPVYDCAGVRVRDVVRGDDRRQRRMRLEYALRPSDALIEDTPVHRGHYCGTACGSLVACAGVAGRQVNDEGPERLGGSSV
jgi:hypothetical protein